MNFDYSGSVGAGRGSDVVVEVMQPRAFHNAQSGAAIEGKSRPSSIQILSDRELLRRRVRLAHDQ